MAKRGRLFVPLDAGFFDGDGAEYDDDAQLLFLRLLTRVKLLASDGWLTRAQVELAGRNVASAVDKLTVPGGLVTEVEGRFYIPSWDGWNGSESESDRISAGRSADGRTANHVRWHLRRGIVSPDCHLCRSSRDDPIGYPPDDPAESESDPQSRSDQSRSERNGSDDPDLFRGFEKFWDVYPPRNGKKLEKGKCQVIWKRIKLDDRRAAFRGAQNYARAIAEGLQPAAKDPMRWLRDRCWTDWQEPATASPRPQAPAYTVNGS